MESSTDTSINTATYTPSTPFSHHSPSSSQTSSPPITPTQAQAQIPPPQNVVLSPCAACKILRRRCAEKCVLAPYFPPSEPTKFTIAHRVFGASNIIKFLQDLPESQRADAVSSMVYEASARIRDPVYGCAGAICHLQKQVSDLQAHLAKAQAEVVTMQCQQANLVTLLMELAKPDHHGQGSPDQQSLDHHNFITSPLPHNSILNQSNWSLLDDHNSALGSFWDSPMWT
ncbi:LOB domain-containing protein 1-like [Argentina anserina]|uniref:LOB domain-containing protein 1-like n=1 Tax=Argentina anserina TaxID=57926 RepID=UPI0021767752|nr:LOB domain-containing protein 1-like [Potentilla anserina]